MSDGKHIGPIPQIGYGTWQRNGDEAYECVTAALEIGYRHIDTAQSYGNEESVGKAIEESGIPRDNVFLTTKVLPANFAPGQVRPHAETSLEKLRTDHVDLLLAHWPSPNDKYDVDEYMMQFAEVLDAGLARHIGVSNFTKRQLARAIEILGDRPIATNQCEIHVFLQNRPIVDFTNSKGIAMTAYCPMARGEVTDNAVLSEIAAAHEATNGQVALAFLMAEGHIVIPSSSNRGRIEENFASQNVVLTPEDIDRIRGLDEGRRLINPAWAPEWDV